MHINIIKEQQKALSVHKIMTRYKEQVPLLESKQS